MNRKSLLWGLASLMDKMPGMSNIPQAAKNQIDDSQIKRTIAIINAMTPNGIYELEGLQASRFEGAFRQHVDVTVEHGVFYRHRCWPGVENELGINDGCYAHGALAWIRNQMANLTTERLGVVALLINGRCPTGVLAVIHRTRAAVRIGSCVPACCS